MSSAERSFSFDGEFIPFHRGDTILTAVRRAGRHIPSLCYHRRTGALSVCRLCVVEVSGRDELTPSCATAAAGGLTVTAGGRDFFFDLGTRTLRALTRPELDPRPSSTDVIGTTHMAASQI